MTNPNSGAPVMSQRADAVIAAAVSQGEAMALALAVVVVDAGGSVVAMRQMPGAASAAIEDGTGRAVTAVLFAQATAALTHLEPRADDRLRAGQATAPGLAAFAPGGVPLTDKQGLTVGAVGVCGGRPDEDHEVAVAAAAAF
jgi:uncharacterized protein GlcG (DUF336 family)